MKLMNCMVGVVALTLMSVLASCDDKDYEAVAPELGEITLSSNPCAPGEELTALVTLAKEGDHYYYFRIYYTVGGVTNVIEKDDITTKKGNLQFVLTAPTKAGTYPVSVKASVSYTVNGQLYDQTNSVSTTLTVEE